jgi:hypothetical protein
MTTRAKANPTVVALAAAIWLTGAAHTAGQGRYTWQSGRTPDGQVTASILSLNTLSVGSSRVIDYHPTLTIACHPGGAGNWSVALRLKDPISARAAANVSVRLDNGRESVEQWTPGFQGRGISRQGSGEVARLLQAKRLRLSWRFGLLAGRGEAIFDLSGIKDAIARLAAECGADLPRT